MEKPAARDKAPSLAPTPVLTCSLHGSCCPGRLQRVAPPGPFQHLLLRRVPGRAGLPSRASGSARGALPPRPSSKGPLKAALVLPSRPPCEVGEARAIAAQSLQPHAEACLGQERSGAGRSPRRGEGAAPPPWRQFRPGPAAGLPLTNLAWLRSWTLTQQAQGHSSRDASWGRSPPLGVGAAGKQAVGLPPCPRG